MKKVARVRSLTRYAIRSSNNDGYYAGPERVAEYDALAKSFSCRWIKTINASPEEIRSDIINLATVEYNRKFPLNPLYPMKTPIDEGYQEFHKMGWLHGKYKSGTEWMIREHGWKRQKKGDVPIIDILPQLLKIGMREIPNPYHAVVNGELVAVRRCFLHMHIKPRIVKPTKKLLRVIAEECPYTHLYAALILIPGIYGCLAPFSVVYVRGAGKGVAVA